jgi:hypothetical protein
LTSDGTEDIKVTVCWTDVPGQPVSPQLDPLNPMLVNNLDLKVTSEGNTYFPWKLNRNSTSAAATNNTENNVDNVEVVYIENPSAGEYFVTIDYDGVLTGGSQAFAIIVSGVTNTIALPTASAGADADVCENSNIQLSGGSTNSESILWSTIGDGIFDDPTLDEPIYTLGANDLLLGSVELKITAYALPPLNDSVSDNMIATIIFNPISNAGENITVCGNEIAQLDGQAENQESVIWSSSGDGTFNDATLLNAAYTPGEGDIADGEVELSLVAKAFDPCQDDNIDNMYVYFAQAPKPNAGLDGETCGSNSYQLNGAAEDYDGVLWTTLGDGTFDDSSLLNAIYTPGSNDVNTGAITLNLTALAISPCPADSTDQMELSILELPNINAGDDASTCENIALHLTGIVDSPTSVIWTSDGDGAWEAENTLEAIYNPGLNDIELGSATLTLTAHFDTGCEMGYDEMKVNVSKLAVANAGSNDSVCGTGSYTLQGEAENQSSIEWTTDGDGNFTDINILDADYTPGANDISNGEVVLNLNVQSIAPCSEIVVSNMNLFIKDCSAIGENPYNKLGFTVVPNPADNHFLVSADEIEANTVNVRVIGINGKSVFNKDFDVDGKRFSTNISSSDLPVGVYTIIISADSKVGTSRLIIQH